MRDLPPCPKDKGAERTGLKWCCLEKYWQNYCLPVLLSSLPSDMAEIWSSFCLGSPVRRPRWARTQICWACGKRSPGCVRARVGFGSQRRESFALLLTESQRTWDSLYGATPAEKLPTQAACTADVQAAQTFSEVWCVWLSVHAYHLTITRTGRKVWLFLFFIVVVVIFFSF